MSDLSDDMSVLDIADEVSNEVYAQVDQWGEQNHPDVQERLTEAAKNTHPCGLSHLAAAAANQYSLPTAAVAQSWADKRASLGQLTWADVLVEEVAEAVEAAVISTPEDLRAELVQVAAVAVSWIAAIDRREAIEVKPKRLARSLWQTITDWWDGIEHPDRLDPKV